MPSKTTEKLNTNLLEAARRRRGLTMQQIADRTDLCVATIYNILHGKCAGVKSVYRVSIELGVDPGDVWKGGGAQHR